MAKASQQGLPRPLGKPLPSLSPHTSPQTNVYCRGFGFWAPALPVPGPTSYLPFADIHIVPGGDTGIGGLNHHDASVPPAARGEITQAFPSSIR